MSASNSRRSFLGAVAAALAPALPAASLAASIAEEAPELLDVPDGVTQWRYCPVTNDQMAPVLLQGDCVTIDLEDRVPSPPGVFLLKDERGDLSLRNVEVVPNSRPLLLRISSGEGASTAELKLLAAVRIEGRAVGAWRPTARTLAAGGVA